MDGRCVLKVCVSCEADDEPLGERLFKRLKKARKAQGLKPLVRLKEIRCLGGCDTPCNVRLDGEDKKRLDLTWLDPDRDVDALLDAAVRHQKSKTGVLESHPGRRA